jgi:signal peptidase II
MTSSGLFASQRTIPITALGILVVDQITKAVMIANVPLHTRVPLIEGLLAFTHVHNRGMAFGLFNSAGAPWLRWLLAAVAIAAVFIIWSYARLEVGRPTVLVAFGCILGGALGNLVDRLRYGYVEDFVLAHWNRHEFPAFNVADAAITMGGIVLFIVLARERDEPDTEAPPDDSSPEIGPEAGSTTPDV